VDAPIPNVDAVVGDYVPSLPPDGVEFPYSEEYLDDGSHTISYFDRRREHRGPKAIWESLTSNVPSVSVYRDLWYLFKSHFSEK
jgi:hypothetical protein